MVIIKNSYLKSSYCINYEIGIFEIVQLCANYLY